MEAGGGYEEKTVLVRLYASVSSEDGESLDSLRCGADFSIGTVKEKLSEKWKQPIKKIILSFQGETLSDVTCLHEVVSDDMVTFMVHGTPTFLANLALEHTYSSTSVGGGDDGDGGGGDGGGDGGDDGDGGGRDEGGGGGGDGGGGGGGGGVKEVRLLTTIVQCGPEIKEVLVRIYDSTVKKPFLGGYRHKMTEVEYHHASAQTHTKPRPLPQVTFTHRDAQTVEIVNHPQQAQVDAATQMNKNGCFISSRTDKMVPIRNTYETAENYHARILKKVVFLQSHWRRWLAKTYVEGVRRDKIRTLEWEKQEAAKKQRGRVERAKREFERRMNPQTKEDFGLLYHALEVWRQEQLAHINSVSDGAERKAALCGLMEQESELIASIGQHKIQADIKNKDNAMLHFLNKMAAPHRWTASDGLWTSMDTPYTLRAKQLRDIYSSLIAQHLTREERLDLLLTLKSTVKEHDCKLTREMVELVDREADLVVRGIKENSLAGLRKRIASLFFQYCKTPLFNPEAAKHIKVPQDISSLTQHIHYCTSCCQYLPSTDFELTTNSRFIGHCRACRDLANQAHAREDWSMYRAMLRKLQQREENFQDNSQLVFLLQEADLCYLVENIWGGQSALSACKDLFELTTVRWNAGQHWSPWNCLVLTTDEAKSHLKLGDVAQAYGPHFVQKVQQRHILARNYFSYIPQMAEELRPKVKSLPMPPPLEREFMVSMGTNAVSQQQDLHLTTNTEQAQQVIHYTSPVLAPADQSS